MKNIKKSIFLKEIHGHVWTLISVIKTSGKSITRTKNQIKGLIMKVS